MIREKSMFTFASAMLAAAAASSMLAVGTQSAAAQAIVVTTPFAFSAGNEFYPVGTYEFGMVSAFSLSIRDVNGGDKKFFNVRPERSRESRAVAVFSNSEGHKNLQAIYLPGADRGEVLVKNETVTNKVKPHVSGAPATMSAEKTVSWKQDGTAQ